MYIDTWICRERTVPLTGRVKVMGIVNVTPDSFSDGGKYLATEAAIRHGCALATEGADLLDIGGESSRPGSLPISRDEELARVIPVVAALSRLVSIPISVDTTKAEVARQALEAGAHIVNDITALRGDPEMADVVRAYRAGVVLMHMQGTPATMQFAPTYSNVVAEITAFFRERLQFCAQVGIPREAVVLDPGIGFGKSLQHNLQLLKHLGSFRTLEQPILLGVSRKGFIGQILQQPVDQRMVGSVAVAAQVVARGAAQILRVHDVLPTRQAVDLLAAIDAVP